MKKKIIKQRIFFIALLFLMFFCVGICSVSAELYNPLAEVTGTENPDKMLVNVIANILGVIYDAVVGLALIFLIAGAILYMLAGGSEQKTTAAKKMMIYAVVGFAIVTGAALFLKEVALMLGIKDFLGDFTGVDYIMEGLGVDRMGEVGERVINLLLASLAMLGLIGIIIGSFWYLHSGGDEEKMKIGKKTLLYSILGLTIAIGSVIIVKQIIALF